MTATIFNIQRFSTHDGPGIRTTVFLKGCPLRCLWCHNPESQQTQTELLFSPILCIDCKGCEGVCPQGDARNVLSDGSRAMCSTCLACSKICPSGAIKLSGKQMTTDEVLAEVLKDIDFYGTNGGITISGGEPLYQPEFTLALVSKAKSLGINVCIDTCGKAEKKDIKRILPFVDTWLWDIKDTNEKRHIKYTGSGVKNIIENLKFVDGTGSKTVIRFMIVGGVNDDCKYFENLSRLYDSLSNCQGIELLTFHSFGNSKLSQLGRQLNSAKFEIRSMQINLAKEILGNRVIEF